MHHSGGPAPCLTMAAALVGLVVSAAPAADVVVDLDLVDGTTRRGSLVRVDEDAVTLRQPETEGQTAVPTATVRRLACVGGPAAPAPVLVTLADGGTIRADDFSWQDRTAVVVRDGLRGEIPIARVRHVAWRQPGTPEPPEWLATIPDRLDSDLVVVGSNAGHECVACAIESVAGETVTVVLDGERIPVKRAKVLGLVWLREPAVPRGAKVAVAGGGLRAERVAWSADGLVLDGAVRLPAGWLEGIDFAAGRTTKLADVSAERTDVAAAAIGIEGHPALAAFYAPRILRPTGADGPADLLLRPRTVAVWRVPAGSRRFRAAVAAAAWGVPAGCSAVTVSLDGREVARTRIGAGAPPSAPPLDVDVSDARRLTLAIEFAAEGDVGCPVRLGDPAFEQ